jgi:hypothetical protein
MDLGAAEVLNTLCAELTAQERVRASFDRCVYRKPKPERSDGEVRQARGVRRPIR